MLKFAKEFLVWPAELAFVMLLIAAGSAWITWPQEPQTEPEWRLVYEDVEIIQVIEIQTRDGIPNLYKVVPSQYMFDLDSHNSGGSFSITRDIEWRGKNPPKPSERVCVFGLFQSGVFTDFQAKPCEEEL